jgi:hypothetical protein
MTDLRIRPVHPDDAASIAEIYAHHVLHGTATFDVEPLGAEEWREKIASIVARGWPFLVAERNGAVAGYAYATQFRDRAAYAETCENSIYIAPDSRASREMRVRPCRKDGRCRAQVRSAIGYSIHAARVGRLLEADDLAILLGKVLGQAVEQRQHFLGRPAQAGPLGRDDDRPVDQDRMGDHRVEDRVLVD